MTTRTNLPTTQPETPYLDENGLGTNQIVRIESFDPINIVLPDGVTMFTGRIQILLPAIQVDLIDNSIFRKLGVTGIPEKHVSEKEYGVSFQLDGDTTPDTILDFLHTIADKLEDIHNQGQAIANEHKPQRPEDSDPFLSMLSDML